MRLIDADALKNDLNNGLWGKEWDKALAEKMIDDAPTVNAVEVVRCGECEYWSRVTQDGLGVCERMTIDKWFGTYAEDFCSYGERMNDEQTD